MSPSFKAASNLSFYLPTCHLFVSVVDLKCPFRSKLPDPISVMLSVPYDTVGIYRICLIDCKQNVNKSES